MQACSLTEAIIYAFVEYYLIFYLCRCTQILYFRIIGTHIQGLLSLHLSICIELLFFYFVSVPLDV